MQYHYRWMVEQSNRHKRKINRIRLEKNVQRVIHDKNSEKKTVLDFPKILNYIDSKFPDIDLSDIQIYLVSPDIMRKVGFRHIAGCYIHHMQVVLVKNEIKNKLRGAFNKLMYKESKSMDREDALVHELIHAVSFSINRSACKFRHMEEEFVYTNCIGFYKQKGMSDEDIVNNNFLPFFINDVHNSYETMSQIFIQANFSIKEIEAMSRSQYSAFLNRHADKLVPLIKTEARNKAYHMIKLYYKYGTNIKFDIIKKEKDSISQRFSNLDWD